jgi:hypothetical protein
MVGDHSTFAPWLDRRRTCMRCDVRVYSSRIAVITESADGELIVVRRCSVKDGTLIVGRLSRVLITICYGGEEGRLRP